MSSKAIPSVTNEQGLLNGNFSLFSLDINLGQCGSKFEGLQLK